MGVLYAVKSTVVFDNVLYLNFRPLYSSDLGVSSYGIDSPVLQGYERADKGRRKTCAVLKKSRLG